LRQTANLQGKELATVCHLSAGSITKIEQGSRSISREALGKYLGYLRESKFWPLEEFNKIESDLMQMHERQATSSRNRNSHQTTSDFIEFTTAGQATKLFSECIFKLPETIEYVSIGATGQETTSHLFPLLSKIDQTRKVTASIFIANPRSSFADHYPKFWINQYDSTFSKVKDAISIPSERFDVKIYTYEFLPFLHCVMLNNRFLVLGFFGWKQHGNRVELSGSDRTHRFYDRNQHPSSEIYFEMVEDWVKNMPCQQKYP
jgi:transcriptional regulator with XRE-family HTH domain